MAFLSDGEPISARAVLQPYEILEIVINRGSQARCDPPGIDVSRKRVGSRIFQRIRGLFVKSRQRR